MDPIVVLSEARERCTLATPGTLGLFARHSGEKLEDQSEFRWSEPAVYSSDVNEACPRNEFFLRLPMRIAPQHKTSAVLLFSFALFSIAQAAGQASAIPASRLINPEALVRLLQSSAEEKPLMIQVGSRTLFAQAHIPGSEYIGRAAGEGGLQQLRQRVESLPRTKFIVLYCGCCPWGHCPNVKPADDALNAMGFTNVKVLYISDNFGMNWVDKGYPVAKGE
jgi:rhodanese-related sulfurtransferase